MDNAYATTLWGRIVAALDKGPQKPDPYSDLKARVVGLDQLSRAEKRNAGRQFRNEDLFEAVLRSILSNSTDWSRVKRVLDDLPELFLGFSLEAYSKVSDSFVESVLVPKFRAAKAGVDDAGN